MARETRKENKSSGTLRVHRCSHTLTRLEGVAILLEGSKMGWSCRKDAARTLDKVSAFCIKSTGNGNTWVRVLPNGAERFFYETSRREYEDGRICGQVFRIIGNPATSCRRVGSFRIEGNGNLTRFPMLPKSILADIVARVIIGG